MGTPWGAGGTYAKELVVLTGAWQQKTLDTSTCASLAPEPAGETILSPCTSPVSFFLFTLNESRDFCSDIAVHEKQ